MDKRQCGNEPPAWEIEVFFDGACPLCRREMHFLSRRDRAGRIRFTDLAAPAFVPPPGLDHETLMARIHGRLPDGTLVEGVEVFRRLYAAVGWRTLARVSRWPVIAPLLDVAYGVFARNRLRLTGRCDDGACAVPAGRA